MGDQSRKLNPKIVAVANQKGGVGKTTTTINLAAALAETGKQILIIDLDPQGNSSTGLGIQPDRRQLTTFELLLEDIELKSVILETDVENLSIVPATVDLSSADIELYTNEKRVFVLRGVLKQQSMSEFGFDFIFIDCPPSLGMLTVNSLTAATSVLVPLQCEFYALEGLTQLMHTIEAVRAGLNPHLLMQGIVLTMYDTRNRLSSMVANDVRGHLGHLVYDTVIPRNVRVSEAPSFGQPVLMYDLKCPGSQAYAALAAEVLTQERHAA